ISKRCVIVTPVRHSMPLTWNVASALGMEFERHDRSSRWQRRSSAPKLLKRPPRPYPCTKVAWCQVFLPGSGWVEFDPTNGIVGNRDLIRVAVARDARQAIPLHGSYWGKVEDEEGMAVTVVVRRMPDPEPRLAAPMTRGLEISE